MAGAINQTFPRSFGITANGFAMTADPDRRMRFCLCLCAGRHPSGKAALPTAYGVTTNDSVLEQGGAQ